VSENDNVTAQALQKLYSKCHYLLTSHR